MSLPAQILGDVASSLIPGTGPIFERLATKTQEEWARNRSKALAVAERVSGLTREDLAEKIAANPELIPLLTRLAYTAGMTGRDELLQTLGVAFGHAVAAPDSVDICEAVLTGAASLQPHDVTVLRRMSDRSVLSGAESTESLTTAGLAAELGLDADVIDASLARLNAAGFARVFHGVFGGGSSYTANEVGTVLTDLLTTLTEDTGA